jgi:putative ABC transport system substrate-binding protein
MRQFTRDLSGKRLELLKEIIPDLSRGGVLSSRASDLATDTARKYYEDAAQPLKIQVLPVQMGSSKAGLETAFQTADKGKVNALVTASGAMTISYRKNIAEMAITRRIPSMCERSDYVEAGRLMSYSADEAESYRRAALYVDKILKGAKPADLPVEQPTKFELVINLKTAKQIGLTIPPNVLARADKVIK